ncbi:MAG: TMF family protein [Cyanobacterium sp. T60_A2020_053]|nr:TMF family protein [Cyanobacterium sp. T60_A2020_053]
MAESISISNSHPSISLFIERLTEFSQSGCRIPTSEELKQIAEEVGISPEDIAFARKRAGDNYTRAQGYCRYRHWDEAINELEEALAFIPTNSEMLHLLIASYLGRWQRYHKNQDEKLIRFRIRQCLEIQADDEKALELLGVLDQSIKNRQLFNFTVGALFCLGFGSLIGFFVLNEISLNGVNSRRQQMETLERDFQRQIDNVRLSGEGAVLTLSTQIREQGEMNYALSDKITMLEGEIKRLKEENKVLAQNTRNFNQRIQILEQELEEVKSIPTSENQ